MSICPACNGTGPVGAVLGVVCGRCDGSGEVCDAAAQAETKGGETMNDELKMDTFVVESMTIEAGRIIPSPALAEAVIGGIAQIIAERDALRADATLWRDHVGQRQAVHDTWAIIEGEAKTFFGDVAALRSENAALKAKWESVPWAALYDPSEAHNRYEIERWYDANAPKEA